MRRALLAVAVAGLLAAAALPARAQGEFPLKYTDAQAGDPILTMGGRMVQPAKEKPADLKAVPKEVSGQVKYFAIPLGDKQVLAVADGSKPPKLYVDTAGTGDLSAAAPVTRSGPEGVGQYGPVALTVGGAQGQTAVKVRFHVLDDARLLFVMPAGYMAGEVTLAGQTYRVAVVSRSSDARYDKAIQFPLSRSAPPEVNMFAIDLNQDGRFDTNVQTSGEVMPLAKMVRVKDVYYSLQVAPDGSSVRVAKIDPGMGTLDAGGPDVEMMVLSDAGFQRFSGSDGKWQAPAGHYMTVQAQLSKTDAAGAKWTLTGSGAGKLENFEVRKGETLSLNLGAPLVTKIEADPAGDGLVSISLALEGRGGERYGPGVAKGGVVPDPPQLKILDESGKELASGKFAFG